MSMACIFILVSTEKAILQNYRLFPYLLKHFFQIRTAIFLKIELSNFWKWNGFMFKTLRTIVNKRCLYQSCGPTNRLNMQSERQTGSPWSIHQRPRTSEWMKVHSRPRTRRIFVRYDYLYFTHVFILDV